MPVQPFTYALSPCLNYSPHLHVAFRALPHYVIMAGYATPTRPGQAADRRANRARPLPTLPLISPVGLCTTKEHLYHVNTECNRHRSRDLAGHRIRSLGGPVNQWLLGYHHCTSPAIGQVCHVTNTQTNPASNGSRESASRAGKATAPSLRMRILVEAPTHAAPRAHGQARMLLVRWSACESAASVRGASCRASRRNGG